MGATSLLRTAVTPAQWQGRTTTRPNAAWLPKATKMGMWAEVAATQEVSGGQTEIPGPGGHRAQWSLNHPENLPVGVLRGGPLLASVLHMDSLK